MRLRKTLNGEILLEGEGLKGRDRNSIQYEFTESAIEHWEKKEDEG